MPYRFGMSVLPLMLLIAAVGPSAAQPPDPAQPQETYQEWLDQRTKEFQSYRFELEQPQPMPLTMEARSLLNWSNAERNTAAGAVFLWTCEGRPEVIACAFGRGQWLRHEFHSLSA